MMNLVGSTIPFVWLMQGRLHLELNLTEGACAG